MSNVQFCPFCGTQREAEAAFCVACGKKISSAKQSVGSQVYIIGFMLMIVMLVFGFLLQSNVEIPEQTPPHARNQQQTQSQAAAAGGESDHVHEDPPFLADLRKRAERGDVEAQITMAEALIQMSTQDAHYLADAVQPLEQVVSNYPEHAYALRMLGNIYYQLEQPAKAISLYERYLALHPDDANVITDMATQLMMVERYEDAIAAYERALAIFPNLHTALYNMSIAYARMDRGEDAKQARARADAVEEQHGHQKAPVVKVSRLPDGVTPSNPQTSGAESAAGAPAHSDFGIYGPLALFFANHEIVGPKMTDFQITDDKAILVVRNFPMEAMPPFARQAFDEKVKQHLSDAGPAAALDIRDADSQEVLATYINQ